MKNKHGLPRRIPDPVKREVRQRCGFGCVICGLNIVQYEHVDPVFSEAKSHNPSCITLLCPHCHAKVTTGFMSKETVKKNMITPICMSRGFASEEFDVGDSDPIILFAGTIFSDCNIPIQIRNTPLIKIEKPEVHKLPYRISAIFTDSSGKISLIVKENEWFALTSNWDVETSGGSIVIRERPRNISLKLTINPPRQIIIENINMSFLGIQLVGGPESLTVIQPNGQSNKISGGGIAGCNIGI